MTDRPSAPQPVALNINNIVRVRLTNSGRAALKLQHSEFLLGPYTPPKEDSDGWSEWQLWELMQDLGHLCRMGGELPFETTIQLPLAALDAAVAAARAEERERWAHAAEAMAQEADSKFPMDGTVAHWLRSLVSKRSDAIRAATPQEPTK